MASDPSSFLPFRTVRNTLPPPVPGRLGLVVGGGGWVGWVGWVGWLAGWVGWVGWLVGLAGWLVGWLAGWLVGWLVWVKLIGFDIYIYKCCICLHIVPRYM